MKKTINPQKDNNNKKNNLFIRRVIWIIFRLFLIGGVVLTSFGLSMSSEDWRGMFLQIGIISGGILITILGSFLIDVPYPRK